jgi:hypothetical protein
MARFFIRIKDGQPFEHPIHHDNFVLAFPDVDINNLPPEFAEFIRHSPEIPAQHEVLVEAYGWVGDKVTDEWIVRPMTDEERKAYDEKQIKAVMEEWELRKQAARMRIANPPGEPARIRWMAYLEKLNAWELVDHHYPNFPTL